MDLPAETVTGRQDAATGEPSLHRRKRALLWGAAALGVLALAFHIAHGQLGLGGPGLNRLTYDWLYDGIIVGGACSCLARGLLVRRERAAWLVLGAGLLCNATGEVYYSLAFGDSGTPPIPSLADLFYLLYYPAAYVGLGLLVRDRIKDLSPTLWLDGAIAALTAAAVIAAVAFEPIAASASHGDAAAIATNFAYPIGDLLLLSIAVGVTALTGWRPGRAWLMLAVGLATWTVADTGYLYASANGTYQVGGWLDSLWLAAALATGFAAWQPSQPASMVRLDGLRQLVVPAVFGVVSVGVLLYGGFRHVGAVGLVLAAVALVVVIARAAWTFAENQRLLERSRHDALTDSLTGLGNRRRMQRDLESMLAAGEAADRAILVMFDLDGFKLYNDRFGHVAGDALLAHLGRELRSAIGPVGSAYRPGGDEFSVIVRRDLHRWEDALAAASAALSSEGDGFSIGSSFGTVQLPREARNAAAALRIADDRMYAQKGTRRGSARQQTHDVLLGVLRERQPDLHQHLREVGRLAAVVGRRLGMDADDLDVLGRAAELHDVGKAAVPDSILNKPGPLSEEEWAFMRRHTLVGERILAAAPALVPVAEIVRASHERWDGSGYPDRLAGTAIPLGARIVSVCDAFEAMTSDRPYAGPMNPLEALEELRRHAGSQFDPDVVREFVLAFEEHALGRSVPAGSDLRAAA